MGLHWSAWRFQYLWFPLDHPDHFLLHPSLTPSGHSYPPWPIPFFTLRVTCQFPKLANIHPEDGGSIFLRKVSNRIQNYPQSLKAHKTLSLQLTERAVCWGGATSRTINCHGNDDPRHCSEGQQLLEQNTCTHGDVTEHHLKCHLYKNCFLQVWLATLKLFKL